MNVSLHAAASTVKLPMAIQPVLESLYGVTSLDGVEHGYLSVMVVVTFALDTVLTLKTMIGVYDCGAIVEPVTFVTVSVACVDMEEAKWSAKLENQEYVICKLCGHRAESLARHLLAEHGITAKQYKVLYPDALIRSIALKAVRGEAIRQGLKCFGQKGRTKQVICPDCSQEHAVSLYFAYDMHDPRCPDCKRAAFEEEQDHIYNSFNGKKEPDDYVECRICNYRAENLTSHIRSEHPDFEGYYLDIFCVQRPRYKYNFVQHSFAYER